MLRVVLTALCRLVVRIFFRRVEVVGEELLPRGGILLAPNHPNALVDPLLVMTRSSRPVSFLAKAPLFRTFLVSVFVKAFRALPVYRAQDGFETSKNKETLTAAAGVLASGGAIAIFPEGRSHDEPKLSRLKTGAARIALGGRALARGNAPVHVVPCGIVYLDKRTFRSEVVIVYGAPIPVERVELDENGEPPFASAEALTEKIKEGLDALLVQAEDPEVLELSAMASALIRGARRDRGERHSLPDLGAGSESGDVERERRLRRLLVEGHARLAKSPALPPLIARIRVLEELFRQFNLDIEAGVERGAPFGRALTALIVLGFFAPIAIFGAIVSYPPYRLVGLVTARMAKKDETIVATFKILGGLLFFPAWWILLAILGAIAGGWVVALVLLVLLPASGYAALLAMEAVPHVSAWARVVALRMANADAHAELARERDAIYEALLALDDRE
jgi:glycerol-3-phosphate O-acyltransferase/dihydroxyacetone phosphate acyltransferase